MINKAQSAFICSRKQFNFDHKSNIMNRKDIVASFFQYVIDVFSPFTAPLFFLLVLLFLTSQKGSNWSDIKIERERELEMQATVEEFGLLVDLLIKVWFEEVYSLAQKTSGRPQQHQQQQQQPQVL